MSKDNKDQNTESLEGQEDKKKRLRNHPLTGNKSNDINCSKNYVFIQCGNLLSGFYHRVQQRLLDINYWLFLRLYLGVLCV
jgi:hypothetical protein